MTRQPHRMLQIQAQEERVPRRKRKQQPSEAHLLMWTHLDELRERGVISIAKEYQFELVRKWKFDFAFWPTEWKALFAVEIDGGGWIQGRHNTGSGSEKDREKFNHAALGGWRVLKFTPRQVLKGQAIAFIKKVLEAKL